MYGNNLLNYLEKRICPNDRLKAGSMEHGAYFFGLCLVKNGYDHQMVPKMCGNITK